LLIFRIGVKSIVACGEHGGLEVGEYQSDGDGEYTGLAAAEEAKELRFDRSGE
jgi:hypothetical protein